MDEYFTLQFTRIGRKLKDSGIHPVLGYLMVFATFIISAELLFLKSEYAKYMILLIAFSGFSYLSNDKKNEFLKVCYGNKKSRIIRIIENLLFCVPIGILLIFHSAYHETLLLILIGLVSALFTINVKVDHTLPTPFSSRSYEFIVGFRQNFYIFIISYILVFVAIVNDNYNLGVFSLLLVFFASSSFYLKSENEYFIWSYSKNPRNFLFKKIKLAMTNTLLMASPVLLSLIFYAPSNTLITAIFTTMGLTFLAIIILAKYARYPDQMSLPDGFIIISCIYFPPLLLVAFLLYYKKALQKLSNYLYG